MKLWRCTRRSTRRCARTRVRDARTVAWPRWWYRIGVMALRRAGWQHAWTVALMAHLPFAFYLGNAPLGWLGGAWQVSAVLVGLVVTLIIFLVSVRSTQSLRTQATFRTILSHTLVLWPLAFAIIFIASVALIERFDGKSPAPGWTETYAVVLFVIQVLLFGAALARSLGVVSSQGVAEILKRSYVDRMLRAVERDLTERVATHEISTRAREASVRFGAFLAQGHAVTTKSNGWVVDIDLGLPGELALFRVATSVTLTAELGRRTSAMEPLARSEDEPRDWLIRMVRKGTKVSRHPPSAQPPDDFLADALDLAWEGVNQGSPSSVRAAVELLSDLAAALPAVYATWGIRH